MSRAGLDQGRVVEQAGRIADSDGLAAVTLARVAAELGVRAPSLYNHVDGRAGLMRQLSLRSLGELDEALRDAALGRSGTDALVGVAHAYRAYAHRHPGRYAATVTAAKPGDEEVERAGARALDAVLAVLGAWELEGQAALHQVRVIRSALHGFVSLEADGGFGLPLALDETFALLLATLVAGLDSA
ncbi:MAG TPA: TetR-like C-terminal domain-containing protein [Solirubrobacteraceae bacterium]|nr:TetR-like C-terminal domain-containing protein [Solirubrobacteraceae bacterium]